MQLSLSPLFLNVPGVQFMRKAFLPWLLAAVVVGGLLAVQGAVAASMRRVNSTSTANETYMVIKVGDEYRAIRSNSMKDEKKRIEDENKKALIEWKDAIKSDPKTERPVLLFIRVIKPGFFTQKGAEEYIAKLLDDEDTRRASTSRNRR
jgi:hypothetical protein